MEEPREALAIAVRGVGVVFMGLSLLVLALMVLGRLLLRPKVEPRQAQGLAGDPSWSAEPAESPDFPTAPSNPHETEVEEMVAVAAALVATWQPDEGVAHPHGPASPDVGPSPWRAQGRQRSMSSQGNQRRSRRA